MSLPVMTLDYALTALTPGELDRAKQAYRLDQSTWREQFYSVFPGDRVAGDPSEMADLLEPYFAGNG